MSTSTSHTWHTALDEVDCLDKLRHGQLDRNKHPKELMAASLSTVKRLGKRELGRYAFETRMPNDVLDIISREDDSNNHYGVIPTLVELLKNSRDLAVAYLCTPEAVQVSKIPKEGGHFCGYRNIQMLWLSLQSRQGKESSITKPNILEVQDMIEEAWDAGINPHGRVQTGGVKGTRKHIGTSEAEAILLHRSIACTGNSIDGPAAWSELLDYVEVYFTSSSTSTEGIIKQTKLPPIFLQRPHHSITTIGFEKTKSGKRRLLVFDPAWRLPRQMTHPRPSTFCPRWTTHRTLKSYRMDERYLKRFDAFETLAINKAELTGHNN